MGERAQTKAFDELLKVCKSILWRAKFTLLIFHLLWHRELWRTHLLTAPNSNRTPLPQKCLRFANTGNLFSWNPKSIKVNWYLYNYRVCDRFIYQKNWALFKGMYARPLYRDEEMSQFTCCKFLAVLLYKQFQFIVRCIIESFSNPSQFCGLP